MGQISITGTRSRIQGRTHTRDISEYDITNEVDKLVGASLSDNTWQAYNRGLASFHEFRSKFKISESWPAPLCDLVRFIAYLSVKGISFNTAQAYIQGISFHNKIGDQDDATQKFVIKKMLEGMRRLGPTKDTRLPITIDMLSKILGILNQVCRSHFEAKLFAAAFSLAFHAFLRVGEIAVSGKANADRVLTLQNTIIVQNKKIKIKIHCSKTDQLGRGSLITVPAATSDICPVERLAQYLQIRPKHNGPLFIHFGREPVTRYQFSAVLRRALICLGFDPSLYKSHSFRIGAATSASMLGMSDEHIKKMGRWKSEVFRSYIRT